MAKSRRRYAPIQYRARGTYQKTGRESWVTNVWRDAHQEAVDDLRMFGHGYKKKKIIKIKWK